MISNVISRPNSIQVMQYTQQKNDERAKKIDDRINSHIPVSSYGIWIRVRKICASQQQGGAIKYCLLEHRCNMVLKGYMEAFNWGPWTLHFVKKIRLAAANIHNRRVKIAKKWPFGGKKKDSTEMYTNDTSGYVE